MVYTIPYTESGKDNAIDQIETSSLEIFTAIEDPGVVIIGYGVVSSAPFIVKLRTHLEFLED